MQIGDKTVDNAMRRKLKEAGINVKRIAPNTPLKKVLGAARRANIRINLDKVAELFD